MLDYCIWPGQLICTSGDDPPCLIKHCFIAVISTSLLILLQSKTQRCAAMHDQTTLIEQTLTLKELCCKNLLN